MTDKPNDSSAPEDENHDEDALREADERLLLHDTNAAEEGASEAEGRSRLISAAITMPRRRREPSRTNAPAPASRRLTEAADGGSDRQPAQPVFPASGTPDGIKYLERVARC